jgi:hypothetical protein
MVRQFVKKTGMADNTATEVFTITTTNEAGSNDGGVWSLVFLGMACHGTLPAGDCSVIAVHATISRAMGAAGAGVSGAASGLGPAAANVSANNAGNKTVVNPSITLVETSEYISSIKFQVDLQGAVITTGEVYGMVELIYAGFTTPPVVTSAG